MSPLGADVIKSYYHYSVIKGKQNLFNMCWVRGASLQNSLIYPQGTVQGAEQQQAEKQSFWEGRTHS